MEFFNDSLVVVVAAAAAAAAAAVSGGGGGGGGAGTRGELFVEILTVFVIVASAAVPTAAVLVAT
jgi:hypothetical protein